MARASRQGSPQRAPKRAASRPRFQQRFPKLDTLPIIHRHAAGIDLGGGSGHFVAVELGDALEVREFGCTTPDLEALVAYLRAQGVTTVAMEATGVYWMPLYDLLEAAGLEVFLVNPSHAKNVPGRPKSDKLDCRWLQKLHKFGLLSASFRPGVAYRPLRHDARQRAQLVQMMSDEMRRMQKALDMMNVQPHKVLSDLGGATGLAIIRAIVAGTYDPAALAAFRDPRCQCTEEELIQALTGHYQRHLVTSLGLALARYDLGQQQLVTLDQEIEATLQALLPAAATLPAALAAAPVPVGKHAVRFPVQVYVARLLGVDPTTLPGIGPQLAFGLLAELGPDLSRWPTEKHFGAYLGLAPQPKISGGKVLSARTRPGAPPAAVLFKQAAAAVVRTDTALGAFYRRLAGQIGSGKALTATAYKLARRYYHLLRDGAAYVDVGAQQYEARYRARQLAALEKRARALGYQITPVAA